MDFADRMAELQAAKNSLAALGVDPQMDTASAPGVPKNCTLSRFCCEIVEACAPYIVAVKPQLAFFEARGVAGLIALTEVLKLARTLKLITIADAKRGDIGSTSAAYAEAFLANGDFACDAITVNPYLGSDALAPFIAKVRHGRGLFVLVKTSNPSSGEFQDLAAPDQPLWEKVALRVRGWGDDLIGKSGLSSVGAVVGATYPQQARRARQLIPNGILLVPGYGAQGAGADDALASIRPDGLGVLVNASRSLMYAWRDAEGVSPGEAAAKAAEAMRDDLNRARRRALISSGA